MTVLYEPWSDRYRRMSTFVDCQLCLPPPLQVPYANPSASLPRPLTPPLDFIGSGFAGLRPAGGLPVNGSLASDMSHLMPFAGAAYPTVNGRGSAYSQIYGGDGAYSQVYDGSAAHPGVNAGGAAYRGVNARGAAYPGVNPSCAAYPMFSATHSMNLLVPPGPARMPGNNQMLPSLGVSTGEDAFTTMGTGELGVGIDSGYQTDDVLCGPQGRYQSNATNARPQGPYHF
jgi:hypothetical protein